MKQHTLLRRQAGNTLLGFVVGLIVGLALAAIVAVFVTKAPVPFMSKATPHVGDASAPAPTGPPPDPNKPLYGRDTRPSVAPAVSPPVSADAAPATGTGSPPQAKKFSFYDLMPGRSNEPAAAPPQVASASPNLSTGSDGLYSLQAGAFKSASDADAMRGRLAMLGFDAQVTPVDRNGDRLYRVRIGPVGRIDDANRAKQTLAKNGIDASLIKSQP